MPANKSASRSSLEDLAPKAASVTERLTDPAGYTGTHKQRFDEEGHGRGLIGRHDVVRFDGSTNSAHRDHTVRSDDELHPKIEHSNPLQKSSSQASLEKAKRIKLYEYAEKFHQGEDIVLNKSYPSIDSLKEHAAWLIPSGKPKVILDSSLHEVRSIDDMDDGAKYLAITPYDRSHLDEGRIPIQFRE
ncbi:hypothetical protein HK104_003589 [Borealophlyctis nickersoniae]|nr:hypothetical protein HK104_003589 [Borealophlyctis nickersoniae]